MNKLVVAFIVDENLIIHLKPVISSITSKLSIDFHVCILTNIEENIEKIYDTLSFLEKSKITVKTIKEEDKQKMDEIYFQEERVDIKSFIYSQIYLCHYFDEHKKILFMEPDQIVRVDLAKFWEEVYEKDIKLAAVESQAGEKTLATLKAIYPNRPIKRYNAGVVLYDTEYWKSNRLLEKCIEECINQKYEGGNRFNFYVEGAMNIALQDYYKILDKRYNCMDLGFREDIKKEEIEEGFILHWNGNSKPWKANGLYKEYYIV